jgi:peptidoglycan hydrolase-like protein with peptidoglycan-binding domain
MTAAVWRVWQTQLNQSGHYKAAKIDGRPGRLTYSAIQSFVGTPVTGRLSTQDKKAVQRYLEKCGYMVGKIDGRWGRMTYTALQKSLNESKWFEKKEGEC